MKIFFLWIVTILFLIAGKINPVVVLVSILTIITNIIFVMTYVLVIILLNAYLKKFPFRKGLVFYLRKGLVFYLQTSKW